LDVANGLTTALRLRKQVQSDSPFRGNGEPLYLFVLTQFQTENRFTFFLELL
jgi:hypothetical protein